MCPGAMRSRAASGLFGRSRGPASGRTSVTAVVALLVACTWLMTVVVLVLGPGGGHDASASIGQTVADRWASVSKWSTEPFKFPLQKESGQSSEVGSFIPAKRPFESENEVPTRGEVEIAPPELDASGGKDAAQPKKAGRGSKYDQTAQPADVQNGQWPLSVTGGEERPPAGVPYDAAECCDDVAEDARSGAVLPERRRPRIELVSWRPRVAVIHDFLNDTECDRLIALGAGELERSARVQPDGRSAVDRGRTSSGSFLGGSLRQDPIVQAVEASAFGTVARIAENTFLPPENGEVMQILRYENGQFYGTHYDLFSGEMMRGQPGGNRVATMIMYLSDVQEGGETLFPTAYVPGQPTPSGLCGGVRTSGVSVSPKKGNAVFFWNKNPDGRPDPESIHTSCTVLKGEKWSATKWIRERSLEEPRKGRNPFSVFQSHSEQEKSTAK
ncbi:Prolyl 4-hydroxylase alpha subunit [Klebsormidium nitens]|uniref:Prolyl 4-hydroxylase alpha subunit n=1 Tax=Klebsormidium nitens TaxID=105231 RepID=A0A1Y1HZW4_KLENI|nr:Prolyl 4-hydroxylase alpha subunit [Klebsormidium nitens]|eukprot:GAQ84204.1 Prolyl 4-hydroxylase alpha subunit [Klebsormidium nitens]